MKVKSISILLIIATLSSVLLACDIKNPVTGENSFKCSINIEKEMRDEAKEEIIKLNCEVVSGAEKKPSKFEAETPLTPSIKIKDILDMLEENNIGFSYKVSKNEFGEFISEICGVEADSSKQYFGLYINEELPNLEDPSYDPLNVLEYKIKIEGSILIEFILAKHL